MSPTQRSLAEMRKRGYLMAVVEKWIPGANIRQDLYGLWDLIGIGEAGEVAVVQTTSASNLSARLKKIAEHDNVGRCRKAGWKMLCHGWAKRKGRWVLREVDVS